MKAYIVTLFNVPQSVAAADRCLDSAKQFGLDASQRSGCWRTHALAEMYECGLRLGKFDEKWSNTDAVVGNFMAQHALWKHVMQTTPAVIMEHDAVVVAPIPENLDADLVTLGKPSFGVIKEAPMMGLQPVFSTRDKIPGAHGYYLTPAGAAMLLEAAERDGVYPVDKFINPMRFPWIREYYPWPIEAHDTFTTIQKEKGCLSKHNYKPGEYQIL